MYNFKDVRLGCYKLTKSSLVKNLHDMYKGKENKNVESKYIAIQKIVLLWLPLSIFLTILFTPTCPILGLTAEDSMIVFWKCLVKKCESGAKKDKKIRDDASASLGRKSMFYSSSISPFRD